MMAAITYDLFIEQGAEFNQRFIWKDGTGAPVNLSGYTARMQIRPALSSDTVLLSLTTENNRITLGGSAGTIDLTIGATATAALTRGGVYDLELVQTADDVVRFAQGAVTVSKEVTRDE